MARLPTVGGDNNNWGEVLNDFLEVSHSSDGSLKKSSIEASLTGEITSHTHPGGGNVTKSDVEAVLIGDITSHTHSALDASASSLTWDGSSILFTKLNGRYSQQTVSSNLTLTANSTGAILNATTVLKLKGDGTHTLTLSGFDNGTGTEFDKTLNTVNVFLFGNIEGTYVYTILTTYIDSTASPVFQSASITNTNKAKIVLVTDLNLDSSSVPSTGDFTVTENGSAKTLSNIAISGKNVEITASSNFTAGTTVVLSYTAGSNPIQAGAGRTMSNLSSQSVTNSVSDPVTLSAPTNFQATPVSGSQINLSWTTVSNASNYEIYYSVDNSTFSLIASPAQATSSYAHSGLAIATQYYYYIKSIGDITNYLTSSDSSTITATTNSASALATPVLNTPTITSSSSLNITWADISNESGYQLQRSTDNSTWSNIGSQLAVNTTTYDDTGLTLNQIYYYRLQAVGIGAYSNSAWSSSVNKTITNFTFSSASTSTDGTYLDIVCNKSVASGTSGITLYVGGVSKPFSYSVVSNNLRITPNTAFISSDVITLDYSPGDVVATDSTPLVAFTGQSVTNAFEALYESILASAVYNGSSSNSNWTNPISSAVSTGSISFSGDFSIYIKASFNDGRPATASVILGLSTGDNIQLRSNGVVRSKLSGVITWDTPVFLPDGQTNTFIIGWLYEQATNTLKVRVDGSEVSSFNTTGYSFSYPNSTWSICNSSLGVPGAYGNYYNVIIVDRLLNSSEINSLEGYLS